MIFSLLFKIPQIFFLFFLITFLGSSCSDEKVKPVSVSLKETEIPDQESWNTKVVFSDSGKIRAILRAGHILSLIHI
ncbi:MAG: hypothetical protein N3A61_05920, partial [Ignavibacteria bacterium]|nr:hypothetical protein [Ignavibacteria bacterium]